MKPDPFHPLQRAPDLSVRPAFRVVGAILLVGVAALFISKGMAVFSQEITTFASCDREGKGRLWCELGKLLLAQMPASARGPALSVAAFATATGALLLCWWLLRPVLAQLPRHRRWTRRAMDIEPKSLNIPLHQEPGPWRKIGFALFMIALVLLLALSGIIVDTLIDLLLMLPLLVSRTVQRWVGRRGVVGVMLFFVAAVLYSRLIRAVLLPGIKDVLATLSA